MKRSLILVLLMALLIPAVAVTCVASLGMATHERAMAKIMSSYVMNMAENVAAKIQASSLVPFRLNRVMIHLEALDFFSWGPELPGWVAVLDSSGKLVTASPGAGRLGEVWRMGARVPMNRAVQVRDDQDERYTLAVYPTDSRGSFYVVAAVRWGDLLGPMVRSNRLWMILLFLTALSGSVAVVILWRWIIGPLKRLTDDVAVLRWGDEVPCQDDSAAVVELRNLRQVLCRLSLAAKDRMELWKRYTSDMVRVQEDEKDRFAREIHDGVVQEVTALVQRIRLSRMEGNETDRAENLRLAEEIGTDTVRELRELCNQLTPPWLDLGLEHALTELTERLNRYMGVPILLEIKEESLSSDGVLAFFRITQEAISNAVKHGHATEISVQVDRPGDCTRLIIEDNGSGFSVPEDLDRLRASGHRGLSNMRERIQLIGGDMEIQSELGKGTILTFTVPDGGPLSQFGVAYLSEPLKELRGTIADMAEIEEK